MDFREQLVQFTGLIIEELERRKDTGILELSRHNYVKRRVEHFEYDEGNIRFHSWHERFQRDQLGPAAIWRFVDSVINGSPGYAGLTKTITASFKLGEDQANELMRAYIVRTSRLALHGLDTAGIQDSVETLINDLSGRPSSWHVETWGEGLWLEEEEFDLPPNVRLRRPRPNDFEWETWDEGLPVLRVHPLREMCPFIAEIKVTGGQAEVDEECETLFGCLRLFRLGSVTWLKRRATPTSYREVGGVLDSGRQPTGVVRYAFKRGDVPRVQELMRKCGEAVRDGVRGRRRNQRIGPIVIAAGRYEDAVVSSDRVEGRLTTAVTALEALYLERNDQAELGRRLRQRAAMVLGRCGFAPVEVDRELKAAYSVRSAYVHGAYVDAPNQLEVRELLPRVLEYVRVSLCVFFQLAAGKEMFLRRIDLALIDEAVRSELAGELSAYEVWP